MNTAAIRRAGAAAIMALVGLAAHAVDLTGAGASFPYPLYAKWAAAYHKQTGERINYQSMGSGGGQQQIIAGTVDFGASDDPMSGAQLARHGLLQFPSVVGGTVPVVHIEGVGPNELRLTGPLLADIYLGKVSRWDDPAIVALNPELELPPSPIVVVHRADGSGTTYTWTDYLSKVSPQWKEQVGTGKAVRWPIGQGGKGNEGVAAYVRQLKNSIGYVEYAYAGQGGLAPVLLRNRDGGFTAPGQEAFAAAAAHADWGSAPGMGVSLTDMPGADSWPITTASFILVPRQMPDLERGRSVLAFFDWAYGQGDALARELHYVPLPDAVVDRIARAWREELRGPGGAPVWSRSP